MIFPQNPLFFGFEEMAFKHFALKSRINASDSSPGILDGVFQSAFFLEATFSAESDL
jgi:hypothetical protein